MKDGGEAEGIIRSGLGCTDRGPCGRAAIGKARLGDMREGSGNLLNGSPGPAAVEKVHHFISKYNSVKISCTELHTDSHEMLTVGKARGRDNRR